MQHVMLDLKTMGRGPTAAVVQIGVVEFELSGGALGYWYKRSVALKSSLAAGLKLDASTVEWWLGQSDAARTGLLADCRVSLPEALREFAAWFAGVGARYVWGNGSGFDNVILQSAFTACGMECPWSFRDDRDLRTLMALADDLGATEHAVAVEPPQVEHDALEDALYQARLAQALAAGIRTLTGGLR